LTAPALAGDTDPLFVNMTTDDAHRANMAITFGKFARSLRFLFGIGGC